MIRKNGALSIMLVISMMGSATLLARDVGGFRSEGNPDLNNDGFHNQNNNGYNNNFYYDNHLNDNNGVVILPDDSGSSCQTSQVCDSSGNCVTQQNCN